MLKYTNTDKMQAYNVPAKTGLSNTAPTCKF